MLFIHRFWRFSITETQADMQSDHNLDPHPVPYTERNLFLSQKANSKYERDETTAVTKHRARLGEL